MAGTAHILAPDLGLGRSGMVTAVGGNPMRTRNNS
jgi:hypothetical protein